MANAYYNSAGKEVVDGDIAYADDLNAINTAVNAGLNLVETDIQTIETNQPYYTNLAQKWATEVEDTQVTTGKYSSLHYAAKASASATTTAGYVSTATTKASEASASAVSAAGSESVAVTKAGEASASAISASSSAGAATTKAGEASSSAIAAAASVSSINKDGSGGVAGLTLFKLNMRNVLNTFTSFFTNSNTASRTYTLPDKDGTIAVVDSESFSGVPTAPTAAAGTNTTQIATTAFVTTADNLKAPLASPSFTGTPTCPTIVGGRSSLALANNILLDSVLSSHYSVAGGEKSLGFSSGGDASLGITQIRWGSFTPNPSTSGGAVTVNYTVPFSTGSFLVLLIPYLNDVNPSYAWADSKGTSTGFVGRCNRLGGSVGYIAFGY